MREIKFRAKKKEDGKWVYGNFYHDQHCTNGNVEDVYIIRDEFDNDHYINIKTLGQLIGLPDKDGKEIYEDDIVNYTRKKPYCPNKKCNNDFDISVGNYCSDCGSKITEKSITIKAIIQYDKGAFSLYERFSENTYSSWPICIAESYIKMNELKVIGNIHEN